MSYTVTQITSSAHFNRAKFSLTPITDYSSKDSVMMVNNEFNAACSYRYILLLNNDTPVALIEFNHVINNVKICLTNVITKYTYVLVYDITIPTSGAVTPIYKISEDLILSQTMSRSRKVVSVPITTYAKLEYKMTTDTTNYDMLSGVLKCPDIGYKCIPQLAADICSYLGISVTTEVYQYFHMVLCINSASTSKYTFSIYNLRSKSALVTNQRVTVSSSKITSYPIVPSFIDDSTVLVQGKYYSYKNDALTVYDQVRYQDSMQLMTNGIITDYVAFVFKGYVLGYEKSSSNLIRIQ